MQHRIYSSYHLTSSAKSGSALIGAVLCSFVVGLLSLSYLQMATSEFKASLRSALYGSSLNLAESGVEMAIAALRNGSVSSAIWTGQSIQFLQDGVYQGDVYYVITDALSSDPVIYAQGVLSGHPAGDIVKQVRVELSSGFAPFRHGLAARNGITFSGNGVVLDSFNSNYGPYDSLLANSSFSGIIPAGYGDRGYNRNDDIYIASSVLNVTGLDPALVQGNASVYGYVTVSPTSTASIGPNGKVASYDTDQHDASRVLSDFYANFPIIFDSNELSSGGSYATINEATVIDGSSQQDSPLQFDVASINLAGNGKNLEINGHVRLLLQGDLSVSGHSGIVINSNSSLSLYTAADVNIAGNGVANADAVGANFYVYGTAACSLNGSGDEVAGQSISIRGNGQLSAVVYAPSGDITLNGGGSSGSVSGGMVGFTARVTGGSAFHFDEALRAIVNDGGSFTIKSWLEMIGTSPDSTPIDFAAYSF